MTTGTNSSFWQSEYQSDNFTTELTDIQKQLRQKFVQEYMHDRDPVNAAMRCGFNAVFAVQYSAEFMKEAYTLNLIKEAESVDLDGQKEKDKILVMNTLRHMMQRGNYPSRVAAAAKMSVILGLDAPAKSEQTVTHQGGVMMAPGIAGLDEWEKAAMNSQKNLVEETQK